MSALYILFVISVGILLADQLIHRYVRIGVFLLLCSVAPLVYFHLLGYGRPLGKATFTSADVLAFGWEEDKALYYIVNEDGAAKFYYDGWSIEKAAAAQQLMSEGGEVALVRGDGTGSGARGEYAPNPIPPKSAPPPK